MKSFEFQAKTVEKAIEKGLQELGKSKFDVDVKILENGGLFKKAKVLISYDEDELSFDSLTQETNNEQAKENHDDEVMTLPLTDENRLDENEGKVEAISQEDNLQTEVEVIEVVEEVVVEMPAEENSAPISEEKKSRIYADNKGSKEFLEGLFKSMGIEATIEIVEQDEHTKALISSDHAGLIIGHRGEGLSALQYLANIIEQKQNRNAKRLIVDVADYREKRDDSLKDLADRMARQCLKLRKPIKLKPMNAYERRIVHTYLQNFKGVNTHSVGKEPNRCLIIDVNRD